MTPSPSTVSRLRTRLVILALLLLAAILLALALPQRGQAATAPRGFFGVDVNNSTDVDYPRMALNDVGVTRTVFPANAFMPKADGAFRWDYGDRIVRDSALNGIRVIPIVYGVPSYISTERNATPLSGRAKEAWNQFLAQLVRRYGPNGSFWKLPENALLRYQPITDWQIWNEPNVRTWWGPKPNAKQYGSLLKSSAAIVHNIAPGAQVMTAGIVAQPTLKRSNRSIPGPEYLDDLLRDRGVRRSIDDVAYHPYASSVTGVKKQLESARKVLDRRRAKSLPIWVTEIGWGSRGAKNHPLIKSSAGQKAALRGTFNMAIQARKRLKLAGMLWYQWRDASDDLCEWCESSGLLTSTNLPKPLLRVFASIARR